LLYIKHYHIKKTKVEAHEITYLHEQYELAERSINNNYYEEQKENNEYEILPIDLIRYIMEFYEFPMYRYIYSLLDIMKTKDTLNNQVTKWLMSLLFGRKNEFTFTLFPCVSLPLNRTAIMKPVSIKLISSILGKIIRIKTVTSLDISDWILVIGFTWRTISLLNTDRKILASVANSRVQEYFKEITKSCGFIQKGFTKHVNGTQEHKFLLNIVLDDAKRRKQQIGIFFIDLKDAFPSVQIEALLRILPFFGFPPKWIKLVESLIKDAHLIMDKDGIRHRIFMASGLHQGDALSPLLFNIIFMVLIMLLNIVLLGYKLFLGKRKFIMVKAMAIADDLLVFVRNESELAKVTDVINRFLDAVAMAANSSKSLVMMVKWVQIVHVFIHASNLETPTVWLKLILHQMTKWDIHIWVFQLS
jgi:hypothetical protein